MNKPIISRQDHEAVEAWVASTARYLLHEAPTHIEAAVGDEMSAEQAEMIICARTTRGLMDLIYKTHGVPLRMLWSIGWPHTPELN
jgi:hypothetical protein